MKTIKHLNSKWWYRLIKVIYGLFFVFIALTSVYLVYEENSERQISDYLIQCQGEYTNHSSFHAYRDAGISIYSYGSNSLYDSLDKSEKLIIRNRCDLTEDEATSLTDKAISYIKERENSGDSQLQIQSYIDSNLRPYTITSDYVTVGGWTYIIGYSLLALIIVLVVAEIIKRIFYYVILGTIKPSKDESNHTS